jgi:hypothetical protein
MVKNFVYLTKAVFQEKDEKVSENRVNKSISTLLLLVVEVPFHIRVYLLSRSLVQTMERACL